MIPYMTDFKSIAKTHLKGFAKAFISLLKNNEYDVILAPANSGSAMIVFAEITAQAANLNLPRTLILPVFSNRPGQLPIDNSTLIPKIQANSSLEKNYSKILFMDDEISDSSAFTSCIQLLAQAGKIGPDAFCTILAEGDGRNWEYSVAEIETDFLPYAIKPNPEWRNLIFNLLPDYMLQEFQDKVDLRLTPKEAICLLFSMPLKDLVGSEPYLNYEMLERAEKRMTKLSEYQAHSLELSARFITEAIWELKAKEQARLHERNPMGFGKLLLDF